MKKIILVSTVFLTLAVWAQDESSSLSTHGVLDIEFDLAEIPDGSASVSIREIIAEDSRREREANRYRVRDLGDPPSANADRPMCSTNICADTKKNPIIVEHLRNTGNDDTSGARQYLAEITFRGPTRQSRTCFCGL